jgi:hypothetical protein
MKGRDLLILIGVLALIVVAPEVAAAKAGGIDRHYRRLTDEPL